MLSQILDPFVTITSFRTSLLALGLSHGWAILNWWHLFVAHINCCNSLAREGPGGSVALTQWVRCSLHSAHSGEARAEGADERNIKQSRGGTFAAAQNWEKQSTIN